MILIFPEPFVHFLIAHISEILIMVYFIESQFMFVAWPFFCPCEKVSHSYKPEFLDYKWQVEELGFGPQFPKLTSKACHLCNNICQQAGSFTTSCKMSIMVCIWDMIFYLIAQKMEKNVISCCPYYFNQIPTKRQLKKEKIIWDHGLRVYSSSWEAKHGGIQKEHITETSHFYKSEVIYKFTNQKGETNLHIRKERQDRKQNWDRKLKAQPQLPTSSV